MIKRCPLLLAAWLLMGVTHTLAGPGFWTSNGPEGGELTALAKDPFNPNVLYAAGRGGLYRSANEGLDWSRLSGGLFSVFIVDVATDPLVADKLYALSANTVYRSTDAGMSWSVANTGIPTTFIPLEVIPDPATLGRLFLIGSEGGVFLSLDGGNTWSAANAGLPLNIASLAIDPVNPLHLLAGIDNNAVVPANSLYVSIDGGTSWAGVAGPWAAGEPVTAIAFGTVANEVFAGSQFGQVSKSIDNGVTWPAGATQYLSSQINKLLPHPTVGTTIFAAMANGLFVSTDGGVFYNDSANGITADGMVSSGVADLAFRNGSSMVLYAAAIYPGFFRSGDGGATWLARNNGLRHTNIRAIAANPLFPGLLLAGYGDVFGSPSPAVYASATSGTTWGVSNGGLAAMQIRDLAFDPNTVAVPATSVAYAVGRRDPQFTSTGLLLDGDGGIYKSVDGGVNWMTIDTGIPLVTMAPDRSAFGTVRSIAFDPTSGLAGTGPLQTLFVGGSGRITYDAANVPTVVAARIYRSNDAGASWFAADNGLPIPPTTTGPSPEYIQIVIPVVSHPGPPVTLYAGTFLSIASGAASPTFANGVFKSIDGGVTWVHTSNGLPRLDAGATTSNINIFALAIDPTDADTVYAAGAAEDFVGRVYKTVDGGANWVETSTGITATQDIRALLIDPAAPNTVFAASGGVAFNPGGVYRTEDGGANWQSISIGLPDSVTSLEIDNSGVDPLVHAGTVAGVYSITLLPDDDTDGTSDATEDMAPNNGDGNNDGTADSSQSTVSSLPGVPFPGGSRGNDNYVTLVLTPLTGNCPNLVDVHSVPAVDLPTDGSFNYPHGVIQFELPDCEMAQVEIIYHDGDFYDGYQFRNFGPTTPGDQSTVRWYDFTAQTTRTGNTYTVTVGDGQFGDIRPTSGAILFRGGPGLSETIFADGLESL